MDYNELLWNYSIDEIVRGYRESKEEVLCVFCGERFVKGRIYQSGDQLYDAYGAVKQHGRNTHGTAADYLLRQGTALVGISDVQQQILKLMSFGKEDKLIAQEIGIAQSTVRNHRFKLREKEKQARLYLALMQSLEEKINRAINQSDSGRIEEVHPSARMMDDRYNITDQDREKTLKAYMDENGFIKQFPAKEKKKIILLGEIMKNFVRDREYSEAEVNKILKRIHDDFPTIRRTLVEYGFLDRSDDCRVYRVKE